MPVYPTNESPAGGPVEIEVGTTPSDGTANTLVKTNATGELDDSSITDDGTVVTIAAPTVNLSTNGAEIRINNSTVVHSSTAFGTNFQSPLNVIIAAGGEERRIYMQTQSGFGCAVVYIPASPSQITANQNNYTAGNAGAVILRLSSDASRNITGFAASNGNVSGEVRTFINVGAQNIVLTDQDLASTDVNRFICPGAASVTLAANEAANLVYDGTTQRWRVFKL